MTCIPCILQLYWLYIDLIRDITEHPLHVALAVSPAAALKSPSLRWASWSHLAASAGLSSDIPPPSAVRFTNTSQWPLHNLSTSGVTALEVILPWPLSAQHPGRSSHLPALWQPDVPADGRRNQLFRARDFFMFSWCNLLLSNNSTVPTWSFEACTFLPIVSHSFLTVLSSACSLSMVSSSSFFCVAAVSCALEDLCRRWACSPLSFSLWTYSRIFFSFQKVLLCVCNSQ